MGKSCKIQFLFLKVETQKQQQLLNFCQFPSSSYQIFSNHVFFFFPCLLWVPLSSCVSLFFLCLVLLPLCSFCSCLLLPLCLLPFPLCLLVFLMSRSSSRVPFFFSYIVSLVYKPSHLLFVFFSNFFLLLLCSFSYPCSFPSSSSSSQL